MEDINRVDRFYEENPRESEYRTPFQRDHDRIIYTSAYRRLGGVTQVVNPSEGQFFHNRLTHSIKVAQIGRRIAEKLLGNSNSRIESNNISELGGLDPSVVEAAALAHDLGNPPFGHSGEKELEILLQHKGDDDGFEGNAQSFRVVNKLSIAYPDHEGLNLTRATLAGILKYPWMRKEKPDYTKKFGVYETEKEEYLFARKGNNNNNIRSLESAIMDIADDITYSVHDLEDFYRANFIDLGNIFEKIPRKEFLSIITDSTEPWFEKEDGFDPDNSLTTFLNFAKSFPIRSPYRWSKEERINIHSFSSAMISRFIEKIQINHDLSRYRSPIILSSQEAAEIIFLKYITNTYVISHPSLLRQQYGERKIIRTLFECLYSSMEDDVWDKMLPITCQEQLQQYYKEGKNANKKPTKARIVSDAICSFTDKEAISLFHKLSGISPGSIFEIQAS